MLLFNLCAMIVNTFQILYFNTSNVTIQRIHPAHLWFWCTYFNTSNVTIQPEIVATIKGVSKFQYI